MPVVGNQDHVRVGWPDEKINTVPHQKSLFEARTLCALTFFALGLRYEARVGCSALEEMDV